MKNFLSGVLVAMLCFGVGAARLRAQDSVTDATKKAGEATKDGTKKAGEAPPRQGRRRAPR